MSFTILVIVFIVLAVLLVGGFVLLFTKDAERADAVVEDPQRPEQPD